MASDKLISADALQKAIRDDSYIDGVCFARVKKHIEEAEAVDAVEVVRCKDCKHRAIGDNVCIHPNRIGDGYIEVKYNDFCSYGERREGE